MTERDVEELLIDVRDLDTEWFVAVRVFLDRAGERYLFTAESINRLGEANPEDDSYLLLDGRVVAEREDLDSGGVPVPVWSVPVGQLITRPAVERS